MIHLDTSFLIRMLDPASSEASLLEAMDPDESAVVSAIAWAEFLSGPIEPAERELAVRIVDVHRDVTMEHAGTAARLLKESGHRGNGLSDCLIAAVAISDRALLATANPADFLRFEGAGLKLYRPVQEVADTSASQRTAAELSHSTFGPIQHNTNHEVAVSRLAGQCRARGLPWTIHTDPAVLARRLRNFMGEEAWRHLADRCALPADLPDKGWRHASWNTEAPGFEFVSEPNRGRRSDRAFSRLQMAQTKYWAGLHERLNASGGPVSGNRKAQPDTWMDYAVGRTGFRLFAWRKRDSRIAAGLYIGGENAKALFESLRRDKDSIEKELGQALDWRDTMPKEREIAIYLRDVDSNDKSDWPRQHQWLARRLNELYAVFSPRIQRLKLDDSKPRES